MTDPFRGQRGGFGWQRGGRLGGRGGGAGRGGAGAPANAPSGPASMVQVGRGQQLRGGFGRGGRGGLGAARRTMWEIEDDLAGDTERVKSMAVEEKLRKKMETATMKALDAEYELPKKSALDAEYEANALKRKVMILEGRVEELTKDAERHAAELQDRVLQERVATEQRVNAIWKERLAALSIAEMQRIRSQHAEARMRAEQISGLQTVIDESTQQEARLQRERDAGAAEAAALMDEFPELHHRSPPPSPTPAPAPPPDDNTGDVSMADADEEEKPKTGGCRWPSVEDEYSDGSP